jgi:DNA-directed RNA polymerase subunit RPC12/RpoP
MGEGWTVRCATCGWSRDNLRTGVGWAYHDLLAVLNAIELPYREEVRALLDEKADVQADCGHELFRCPSCGGITSRMAVRLKVKGGRTYRTRFYCTKCGTELKAVKPGQINGAPCPNCGGEALVCEQSMVWD